MHLLNAIDVLKLSFGPNLVQKTNTSIIYEISRMLFSNKDFSLTHFTNFNFAHFEIQESFRLIWVKLQNGRFLLQIFILGIKEVLASSMGFIFLLILCITEILNQFGEKLRKDSLELKISISVLVSEIMVFHFVHFEHKKDFWHIWVTFIVYRVSLLSSQSN